AMVWVSDHVDQRVAYHSSFLSAQARQTLQEYAEQASAAVDKGPIEVDRWMAKLQREESGVILLLDSLQRSLGTRELDKDEQRMLRFARPYDSPMSRRAGPRPLIAIDLDESGNQLIIHMLDHLSPWYQRDLRVDITALSLPIVYH